MSKRFRVGNKVSYRNSQFGTVPATIVAYQSDIKNGRPGYDVKLDVPQDGESYFWGYIDQVSAR
jgi:hypothetical protein